ncbi:twin-arginine translocation signal domain-containing protein [Candidatus Pacearchaeota archaeon]|nr:twin-arginine translocation signal domain-containing protein [Candidatus Pacearchaeota archaeon]
MNRRNFLKGFSLATGTLAVAPAIALAPVESRFNTSAVGSSIRGMHPDIIIMDDIEALIAPQMDINELMTAWSKWMKLRDAKLAEYKEFMTGTEWNPPVVKVAGY